MCLTHSKRVTIDQRVLLDTVRPRIRLPHINNHQKWAYLNEVITEALNLRLPLWKILRDNINKVVNDYELVIYERLKSECGLVGKKRVTKDNPPPRLLQRLTNQKRELRRQFRRLKRQRNPDQDHLRSVFKKLMATIRLHNGFQKHILQNKQIRDEWFERKRFLSNPHSYAATLFAPPQSGDPTFSKNVADDYLKKHTNIYLRLGSHVPNPLVCYLMMNLHPLKNSRNIAGKRVVVLLLVLMESLIWFIKSVLVFAKFFGILFVVYGNRIVFPRLGKLPEFGS